MKPKAFVSQNKKEEVKQIKSLIKKYPCFGIIDLTSLPSATLQFIRHKIKKNNVLIITSKKSLIKIAINDLKDEIKSISTLLPSLENTMPALIFTTMNPFKLASLINKNKSSVAAKPGQLSPRDIIIPAGPTKFTPGPVIGELGAVGIKTIIQEGKLVIKDDITFVKYNEVIDKKKSEILEKLGIAPMEVGVNLVALYETGTVYLSDMLNISEETYLNRIKEAYQHSFNLAVFISYMSKETLPLLIKKAYLESKNLALKTGIQFSEEISKKDTKKEHAHKETTKVEEAEILKEKSFVGYSEETAEKAQNILKELQDQKINEKRT